MSHRYAGIICNRQQVVQGRHLLDKSGTGITQSQGSSVKHPYFPRSQGGGVTHDDPAAIDFRSTGIGVRRLYNEGAFSILGQNGFPVAASVIVRQRAVGNHASADMGAENVINVVLNPDGCGPDRPSDLHNVIFPSSVHFHRPRLSVALPAEDDVIGIPVETVHTQIFAEPFQPVVPVCSLAIRLRIGNTRHCP